MQYSKHDIERWAREDDEADRDLTAEQRLTLALQLFDFYRDTMLGVLRARHPDADERRIDELFRQALDDSGSDKTAA